MAVIKMNILSQTLGMQTNITVILPTYQSGTGWRGKHGPYVSGMRYQVLYLLHGGSGDDSDYLHFTNIVRYADQHKLAVVMPCAYNSCYTDFADGPKYFQFVAEELPLICQTLFPFSTNREDTFVAGLSMGSHGAMKVAVTYPEKFAAALLMSGASYRPGVPGMVRTVHGQFDFSAELKPPLGGIAEKVNDADFIRGTVNDVYTTAKMNAEKKKTLPKIFFRVGDCDHALYRALKAEEDLRSWGYETKIEVVPGMSHEWDLWDQSLRLALQDWLPLRHDVIYPET